MAKIENCKIEQNDKYGRYLVAEKDLDAGELIFNDTPFAVGPKPDSPPLCLGCYTPVENTYCTRCGWPMCGPRCEQAAHHKGECDVFSKAKVKFQAVEDWSASSPQLDCITPLRILLAKEQDPDRWQNELEPLETHTAERQQRPTWGADQVNIADYLVDHCELTRFDKELVQRVCGILEVNSVEVPTQGGFNVRAIYPRLSVAAHNCVPNIIHTILQDGHQVKVRAAVPIKSGEPLYLSYAYALSPTAERRAFLLQSKFFNCDCKRCADPTELGTHLSTLKCSKCDNGVLLTTNPLDMEAAWKCMERQCEFKTSTAAVRKMVSVVQAEVDALDALPPGSAAAVEQREAILNKYKSVFHPRHSVLLSVKLTLAQLYGRVEGYALDELPDLMLERKADFCRQLLATLDVVTPGETRMRGMLIYELHAPLMFLARSEYSAGLTSDEQLKQKLQEPIKCLREAARILTREDPQSPEGMTGQMAVQAMEQLQASIDSL